MSANPAAVDLLHTCRLAVVSGGSSGIGREFIATMGNANPGVCVCNISPSFPDQAGVAYSVCDPAARQNVFPSVTAQVADRQETGKLLFINNSGFGRRAPLHELKMPEQVK